MRITLSDHFTYQKLLRFTMPSIVMMIVTSVYSIVDGFFVSNCVGKNAFAALNLIFPVLMALSAFGFMVGTGGSALIAKTLGEGKTKEANGIFSMLVAILAVGGAVLAAVFFVFIRPISYAVGATELTIDDCVLYGRILLVSLPLFMLQNSFQSFLATAEKPGFGWINIIGVPLISILIVFALLYWVGMARIVRSQVLTLKESEYVTAARALGAGTGRIIKKHILTNCIGTLIVTTTLQIPSAIFTESFLSFLGIGVSAPMPSLGSLASTAIDGLQSYPYRLFAPAIAISVVILSFNLFGDGLRDAFDPKLKN